MKAIIDAGSTNKVLVFLPDVFTDLGRYRLPVQLWWREHLIAYRDFYSGISSENLYGSTFISRPYMDVKKSNARTLAELDFLKLKCIWKNKDILIVEGKYSRSGVGNDLFDGARSVSRIICPSKNAFNSYEEIKTCINKYGPGKLVLLMLGPTAKVLAYELSAEGFTAIDLGHIDSEYEWYKMGVKKKTKLSGKHTAEWNTDDGVGEINDEKYTAQIVCDLSR